MRLLRAPPRAPWLALLLWGAALCVVALAAFSGVLSGVSSSRCASQLLTGGGGCLARAVRRYGAPAVTYSQQRSSARNGVTRDARAPRYDAVHAFILTAAWSQPRAANAARICDALRGGGNVTSAAARPHVACTVLDALRGDALTDADVSSFEAAGLLSLQPLPTPPWWSALVPKPLTPGFREYPANQMTPVNHRWRKCVANTVGCLQAVHAMAADAAVAPDGGGSTLFVFLEDDAELGPEPGDFPAKLLAHAVALPPSWDMLLLAPPPGMCERSEHLPPPWRVRPGGIMAPYYSLSRSTAMALSAQGAARLLAELPATNTIDLWLRELMRARRLGVLVSCAGLASFHATAAHQAR